MYVDGVARREFEIAGCEDMGIKVMAIYNWRTRSVAWFRNLILGDVRPIAVGTSDDEVVPADFGAGGASGEGGDVVGAGRGAAVGRRTPPMGGAVVESVLAAFRWMVSAFSAVVAFFGWLVILLPLTAPLKTLRFLKQGPESVLALSVVVIFLGGYIVGSKETQLTIGEVAVSHSEPLFLVATFTTLYGLLVALWVFQASRST